MHAQITPFYVVLNQNAKTDLVFYDDGGIDVLTIIQLMIRNEVNRGQKSHAMLNHKSNFGSKIHWESVCIGITCLTNFYELVWFVQFQSQYF